MIISLQASELWNPVDAFVSGSGVVDTGSCLPLLTDRAPIVLRDAHTLLRTSISPNPFNLECSQSRSGQREISGSFLREALPGKLLFS